MTVRRLCTRRDVKYRRAEDSNIFQGGNSPVVYIFLRAPGSIHPASFLSFSPLGQPFLNKTMSIFVKKGRFWLHASFPLPFFPFHPWGNPFLTKRTKKGCFWLHASSPAFLSFSPLGQPFLNKMRSIFVQKGRFLAFWLHASFPLPFFPFHPWGNPF